MAGSTTVAQAAMPKTRRPRVMHDVVRGIASGILSGDYPACSTLPSENELGARHGVSRTVIREALKVLAGKGLVQSRPRIGTVVCDPADWNVIDTQVLEWYARHRPDPKLFDAILETRRAIEPLVAELAATRASMQEIADLEAAWQDMAASGDDVARFARADAVFHQVLYAACHNPIFRQIGGLIEEALHYILATTASSVDRRDEAIKVHLCVLEALRMRDGAAARSAAMEILDLAARDLARSRSRNG